MLFQRDANAVQVQRWLGHHAPAFTLNVYVHLLDGGSGQALNLDAELGVQDAGLRCAEIEAPRLPLS